MAVPSMWVLSCTQGEKNWDSKCLLLGSSDFLSIMQKKKSSDTISRYNRWIIFYEYTCPRYEWMHT